MKIMVDEKNEKHGMEWNWKKKKNKTREFGEREKKHLIEKYKKIIEIIKTLTSIFGIKGNIAPSDIILS